MAAFGNLISRATRQATDAGLAKLVAPVADAFEGGRAAVKRPLATAPAATGLVTEEHNRPEAAALVIDEHKRFRLALDGVAEEWLCPITQELPWDPVMAEDSHYYERGSIEEWFRRNGSAVRSPVTNALMGRVLKSAPQVLNTIRRLVESGAITGDKADSWKKRLAQEERVRRLKQRATAGDVGAMRALGSLYESGTNGLQEDPAQAYSLYKQSADLGDVQAMAYVGHQYCHGKGVKVNLGRGTARLGQAAALGSDWACYALALFHEVGSFGCDKDEAEAAYYYAKIPGCTVKHLNSDSLAKAAEWLQAHPVPSSSA
jgi:DNA-binding Lrp family transcriptional regulator